MGGADAVDADAEYVAVFEFEGADGTAWEPDTDYEDYTWHLARTDGGEWKLLTWGYA